MEEKWGEFKPASEVGSLSQIPAGLRFASPVSLDGKVVAQILHDWHQCVICLIQIPWPWRAIFPVESWSRRLCPALLPTASIFPVESWSRRLCPPLLPIASLWACARFMLRKHFVAYALIAFYVFLFKAQAYEGRDLKYLIHFFTSRA